MCHLAANYLPLMADDKPTYEFLLQIIKYSVSVSEDLVWKPTVQQQDSTGEHQR